MCALKPAFTATSLDMLMAKIKRGQREQRLSTTYSEELRGLIGVLLSLDPKQRPSCKDVLNMPLLLPYIALAPATMAGCYEAPTGSTPVLESRACRPYAIPTTVVEEVEEQVEPDIMVVAPAAPAPSRRNKHLSVDHGALYKPSSLNNLSFDPNTPLPEIGRAESGPDLRAISDNAPIARVDERTRVVRHHRRSGSDPSLMLPPAPAIPVLTPQPPRRASIQPTSHGIGPTTPSPPKPRQPRMSLQQLDSEIAQCRANASPTPLPARPSFDKPISPGARSDGKHRAGKRPSIADLSDYYQQRDRRGSVGPEPTAASSALPRGGKLPSLF